MNNAFPVKFS